MGVPARHPRALPSGRPQVEAGVLEQILRQHALPPEIRDPPAERASPGAGAATGPPSALAPLRLDRGLGVGGRVGGRRLSLVDPPEGAPAALDALGAGTLSSQRGSGRPTPA